ncbi:MAG TPA: DUF2818 family protein [Macromonas sp.]|nr:DUF2818 family protein [Macromonas sp.]
MNASVWYVVLAALVVANLPFVTRRRLLVWPVQAPKSLFWHALELLLYYLLVGGLGLALEQHQGQIYPQGWEFYAITLAMFLTFAFPGFVYRYLVHRH